MSVLLWPHGQKSLWHLSQLCAQLKFSLSLTREGETDRCYFFFVKAKPWKSEWANLNMKNERERQRESREYRRKEEYMNDKEREVYRHASLHRHWPPSAAKLPRTFPSTSPSLGLYALHPLPSPPALPPCPVCRSTEPQLPARLST